MKTARTIVWVIAVAVIGAWITAYFEEPRSVLGPRPALAQLNNSTYPAGAIPVASSANGTTGAVVATLPASPARTTYICGFQVSSAGATTPITPITVAGTLGGSMLYQSVLAGAAPLTPPPFTPCVPASALNTAITVTTTASASATAVNVSAWGYQTLDR